MAEAFFNGVAGGRHRGISTGTQPGEEVNPVAERAREIRDEIRRRIADLVATLDSRA